MNLSLLVDQLEKLDKNQVLDIYRETMALQEQLKACQEENAAKQIAPCQHGLYSLNRRGKRRGMTCGFPTPQSSAHVAGGTSDHGGLMGISKPVLTQVN
ncbi:unnamed protein product [Caretta caretta]